MAEGKSRSRGTVKWFSGPKGYGFITPDDGSEDLFVHQTSIQSDGFRTLYEEQRVEYEVDVGEDGRTRAVDVTPMRGSNRPDRRGLGGGPSPGGYGGYGGYRGGRGGNWYGGGGGGGGRGAVECYNCGRFGHVARDCYQGTGGPGPGAGGGGGGGGRGFGGYGRGGAGGRGGRFSEAADVDGYNRGSGPVNGNRGGGRYNRGGGRRGGYYGGGGGGGGGGGNGVCYNCGEEGHFARECPNQQN